MSRTVLLLLHGALGAVSLPAQVGGAGTVATTPTTSEVGHTGAQTNPGAGSSGGRIADVSRPIFISGKVVMQDGSPVPQSVRIQRVCNGVSRTVAYTDANGRFNFEWGDRNAVVADASDAGVGPNRGSASGGFGSAQSAGGGNPFTADPLGNRMMNCEVRADVAGFTSDAVNLFNRRGGDSPDIGMIVIRRIAGVEGSSISVTSMLAPKEARKAYERGLQCMLKNKTQDAAKEFERAVAVYPAYADAWANLGALRLRQQSIEPARAAFAKAIESDPRLVAPYVELGLLAARQADWRQSAEYLDKALVLDAVDFPQAWYADAVANFNLARYDAAEKSAREAVKLDPRHANPRSGYLLGLLLAQKRDYAGAAAELTAYIRFAPDAPDAALAKAQLGEFETMQADAKQPLAKQP